MLKQHTGHGRPHCRTRRTRRTPDPDPPHPLTVVGEDGAQQRERGGHQPGAGKTLHSSGHDEQSGRGRESGNRGCHTEGHARDQQQALAANAVADVAHGDEQAGENEGVNVTDPEDLVIAGMQLFGDSRHRDADDGSVDSHHEHCQAQREQCCHLTPGHPDNPTVRPPRSDQGCAHPRHCRVNGSQATGPLVQPP